MSIVSVVLILILAFTYNLSAVAQTPTAAQTSEGPPPNPQQLEIAKQAQVVQLQSEQMYNKLRDLQEFQDYLKLQQRLGALQQQYTAAATSKPAAVPEPAPTEKPVKK